MAKVASEMCMAPGPNPIRRISCVLNTLATYVVFILIVGMTLSISLQVVSRVFFGALPWTEELARYLLVWSTFIAASVGFYRNSHIAVTFLVARLPGTLRSLFAIFTYLLSLGFFIVGIIYSLMLRDLQVFQISPAMGLAMKDVYMIMPVSFGLMALHTLASLTEEAGRLMGRGTS